MNGIDQLQSIQSRRQFLNRSGMGLGAAVMGSLVSNHQASAATSGLHFPPKAKRVIFMFMAGAPSQLDLFDYKPDLYKKFKQPLPDDVRAGQRVTAMTKNATKLIQPTKFQFHQRGECGIHMSELLPHLSSVVDDVCLIKSMHTDAINHDPAITFQQTGSQIPGRPSIGAWLSYGLGSENADLPAFVAMSSKGSGKSGQPLYDRLWGSGFLPSRYQGVKLRNTKDPVLYLRDPDGLPRTLRRGMLNGISELNQMRLAETGDPEIETRIRQYEMAWRMQTSIPELADLSDEPEATFELYGSDSRRPGTYAANCILARRLIERGVRFVQLIHPDWDHHSRLNAWCTARCRDTDQASAALVTDLKQRGLLDDTLVLWGGEFGRGVAGQGQWDSPQGGRDHHPRCFTMWMAGGGIKSGLTYGGTDEFSYNVARNPVHVRDLHATILHLLGIDHQRFTYRFQGLDFRLTGVEKSRLVQEIVS